MYMNLFIKLTCLSFLGFSQPYLRNHPGLKEKLCCGDITLIFRHMPSLMDCDESILEKVDSLKESEPEVKHHMTSCHVT